MKTLFLLRHAKADREIAFIEDIERPLTERGFSDSKLMSAVLKNQDIIPEKIISSPAVRAYTTALVFATTFGFAQDEIGLEKNLYDSSTQDYLEVISGIDDHFSSCLIAGHNDVITVVAMQLLQENRIEPMKTCGLVIISSESTSWKKFNGQKCKLVLSLYPALLREA